MSELRAAGARRRSGGRGAIAHLIAVSVSLVLCLSTVAALPASAAASGPLAGRGMWIWVLGSSSGGNLDAIITQAREYGVSTVMIKSGDGTSFWSQFNPSVVAALHAAHIHVCAWQYVYGNHPITEAYVGAQAVHDGADCLLIDAEVEYQGKYVQAQAYLGRLRLLIGANFPVALAGFPYVDYHPSFPYSVFLGPGGAQYNAPQMYWLDIGVSVDSVFAHTYAFNSLYGRPVVPLGQLYNGPRPGQILRFRQLSRLYGAGGVSWWDWQSASGSGWRSISQPVGALHGVVPDTSYATVGLGAVGDLVVWAQEHLVSAGQRITVDGSFGPQTQAAVQAFQLAHGLPSSGTLDEPTWQALLRYRPAAIRWVRRGSRTTALATGGRSAFVPASARLQARGYEIPPRLGAGRP